MNLMRYSHSKRTGLFQTILRDIEQKHSVQRKIKNERLHNLINCYLCTVSRSATVLFVLRKKAFSWFLCQWKVQIKSTHMKQINAPCNMRGVFPVCALGLGLPHWRIGKCSPLFCAYKFAIDTNDKLVIITKASQFGWSGPRTTTESKT